MFIDVVFLLLNLKEKLLLVFILKYQTKVQSLYSM